MNSADRRALGIGITCGLVLFVVLLAATAAPPLRAAFAAVAVTAWVSWLLAWLLRR